MFVKAVAVGNSCEAFVENRFTEGFNIIYSQEDNNKGKTILIQSMMYALGNEPIFPESFPFKDYYHICVVDSNGVEYTILRKGKEYLVRYDDNLEQYSNTTEFKRFLKQHLFDLPLIPVSGKEQIVYPYLFYQMFFIGQDKRDCSNIINRGQYSKKDFEEMLYRYVGIVSSQTNLDLSELMSKLALLKEERENLIKQNKALKSGTSAAKQLYSVSDRNYFEKKIASMEELNQQISDLKKDRNKSKQRSIRTGELIKELKSLNNALNVGEVRCNNCGSHNINYVTKSESFCFDVSDKGTQDRIIRSLEEKICELEEECESLNYQINELQKQLDELINDDAVSLESLMAYKNRNDLREINDRIDEIDREMRYLKATQEENKKEIEINMEGRKELKNKLIGCMNSFYQKIDPDGQLVFDNLFPVMYSTYSGSEEMEFYLSKLYSLSRVLGHPYPIIIDSFREGELSTNKEYRVIELYQQIPSQKIFTASLKEEEDHKYTRYPYINSICYDSNETSHILNSQGAAVMKQYLLDFGLNDAGVQ